MPVRLQQKKERKKNRCSVRERRLKYKGLAEKQSSKTRHRMSNIFKAIKGRQSKFIGYVCQPDCHRKVQEGKKKEKAQRENISTGCSTGT